MKKLFLGAILTIGYAFGASGQVTLCSTNFPNAVIPVSWTQQQLISAPTNGGWQFGNTVPGNMGADYMPASGNGYFAFVDDVDNNVSAVANHDTLSTNVFSCVGYNHVFISFDIWYQGYYNSNNNSEAENVTVAVSTDGGHTWTTAITNPYGGWTTLVYDISSVVANQANVKVAFTYYDGGTQLIGMGLDNVTIYSPLSYDLSVNSQNNPFLMQVGNPYNFSGTILNYGGDSVVSMDMNYSVNNGTPNVFTISGISNFNGLTSYSWSDGNAFTPPSQGVYNVKFWANNLNGSYQDQNHPNDTLTATFLAVDSVVARQPIYEEYTGQSCVFCMIAAPNVDSVADNNAATANIIRYHVPIPGRDFMYEENVNQVTTRETYYNVQSYGAPDGFLDGTQLYASTYEENDPALRYSSTTVQADNSIGSPFSIKITSSHYDLATDSFSVSASITAHSNFPAGLTAQVALTIDSIYYYMDLSQDDPQETFAPPVGTSVNIGFGYPGAPDYYYPYVLKFPHVVEDMLPSASGTSLGAFTNGQTQTISLGWKKNHPWGQYPKGGGSGLKDSTLYDSSSTGQFVVFVQTNAGIAADGIPAKYVFQSASAPVSGIRSDLGVQQIAGGISFEMYPNPSNGNTNLAFNLTQSQNVTIQVYNMLGESIYTQNNGIMTSGQHLIAIPGDGLKSGVYFVRVTTDNTTATQKLVIQK